MEKLSRVPFKRFWGSTALLELLKWGSVFPIRKCCWHWSVIHNLELSGHVKTNFPERTCMRHSVPSSLKTSTCCDDHTCNIYTMSSFKISNGLLHITNRNTALFTTFFLTTATDNQIQYYQICHMDWMFRHSDVCRNRSSCRRNRQRNMLVGDITWWQRSSECSWLIWHTCGRCWLSALIACHDNWLRNRWESLLEINEGMDKLAW